MKKKKKKKVKYRKKSMQNVEKSKIFFLFFIKYESIVFYRNNKKIKYMHCEIKNKYFFENDARKL